MAPTVQTLLNPEPSTKAVDIGLLLLRVWLGVALPVLHGWSKLTNFNTVVERFPDVLGTGSPAFELALVVFAEVVAAAMLAIGLLSRFAALVLAFNMAMAFLIGHGGRLTGQGNGELAFLYLAGFVALLFTGPGRYSLDARLSSTLASVRPARTPAGI